MCKHHSDAIFFECPVPPFDRISLYAPYIAYIYIDPKDVCVRVRARVPVCVCVTFLYLSLCPLFFPLYSIRCRSFNCNIFKK
jgi:hypothetical protein